MTSELTIPTHLELDTPLWRFAGKLWARTAVQDACLELQTQGWSVTDLLCALWQASESTRFTGMAHEPVLLWRTRVTAPLRQVRQSIGKGHPATDPARQSVAQSELASEQVELALAYSSMVNPKGIDTKGDGRGTPTTQNSHQSLIALALDNLHAAAPENNMDNRTGKLLDILAGELHLAISGECARC